MPSNFFQFQQPIVQVSESASNVPLEECVSVPNHGKDRFVAGFLVLERCLVVFSKRNIGFFYNSAEIFTLLKKRKNWESLLKFERILLKFEVKRFERNQFHHFSWNLLKKTNFWNEKLLRLLQKLTLKLGIKRSDDCW